MKNKFLFASSLFVACLSVNSIQANELGVTICKSVMNNDKHGLRLALRSGGLKLRSLYEDLRCNDKSLIQIALENSADDVGSYIISKVSKSTLKDVDDLGWAESNGHSGSPIVAELKDRVN